VEVLDATGVLEAVVIFAVVGFCRRRCVSTVVGVYIYLERLVGAYVVRVGCRKSGSPEGFDALFFFLLFLLALLGE